MFPCHCQDATLKCCILLELQQVTDPLPLKTFTGECHLGACDKTPSRELKLKHNYLGQQGNFLEWLAIMCNQTTTFHTSYKASHSPCVSSLMIHELQDLIPHFMFCGLVCYFLLTKKQLFYSTSAKPCSFPAQTSSHGAICSPSTHCLSPHCCSSMGRASLHVSHLTAQH